MHSHRNEIWRSFFANLIGKIDDELKAIELGEAEESVLRFIADEEKEPHESGRGDNGERKKKTKENPAKLGILRKKLSDSKESLYRAFTNETPGELTVNVGTLLLGLLSLFLSTTGAGVQLGGTWSSVWGWLTGSAKTKWKDPNHPELKSEDIETIFGAFQRKIYLEHVHQLQSIEQFRTTLEEIVALLTNGGRVRLLIAIDDIDRCLPEQALEMLEAIQLFLRMPNTAVVVAVDQQVVQYALDRRYEQSAGVIEKGVAARPRILARDYIEKMFDLVFPIPPASKSGFRGFVDAHVDQKVVPQRSASKAESVGSPGNASTQASDPVEGASANGKEGEGNIETDEMSEQDLRNYIVGLDYDFLRGHLASNPRAWKRFGSRAGLNYDLLCAIYAGDIEFTQWLKSPAGRFVFCKLQLVGYVWPAFYRNIREPKDLVVMETLSIKVRSLVEEEAKDPPADGSTFIGATPAVRLKIIAATAKKEFASMPSDVQHLLVEWRLLELFSDFHGVNGGSFGAQQLQHLEILLSIDAPGKES